MSTIQVTDIQSGYGDTYVLEGFSLTIPKGKVTSIIGPNGCGKSTLLKTVGRIISPRKGDVVIDGKRVHSMPTKLLAQKMAILPQSPIAPEGITVAELVAYGRFPHHKGFKRINEKDLEIVNWALAQTGLEGLKDQPVDALSGGQRQRVWIAMAICQETDVILLDEPTTYLDMAFQLEVLLLLKRLNKAYGTTIVMVLHDINLAARVSDHMVAMRGGMLVKTGSPDAVVTREVLKTVYDIDANIVTDPMTHTRVCQSYALLKHEDEETR